MKLLYRISIVIFCIVFVTALILSSYSFQVQRTLINNQLVKKGQVLAGVLSESVLNHLISYDFYAIQLLFEPLKQDDDIMSVALIGSDNYIKMHSDLTRIGKINSFHLDDHDFIEGNVIVREMPGHIHTRYQFFSPVGIDHNREGFIQIGMSDRGSLRLIETFGMKMLYLTVSVLAAAVIAGYLMSRQITNPIIELSKKITYFMLKRPDYRSGNDTKNEIAMLTRNFKTLMSELEHAIEFRVKNEKMAILGSLSSVLAHEVKNPLEPIKGSAEILKLKYSDNDEILKYAGIIQTEVSELTSFLDSFLDVAKTSRISMTALDLNKTLREVLTLLEYSLSKENIAADVRLDDSIPLITGNRGMLKQVFLNLLINAQQAKSGTYGRIDVVSFLEGESICLKIKDYGTGIEESVKEQVFQPFFTTKKDGSGIGLSISRYLIELHSGTIALESDCGGWTEVVITLPIGKGG